ncbi:ATP-binding protein [Streptomyces albipurpureus]|uniref:ATP-binding protein n=1 Tax=Streptomyces albipurpureus TaxID=2897419 RepID=A0ABT0UMF4_9ACTN|nr:ATP-binding protein [Streptomyces sp. CWNU-1]MCM2388583.1 ATP-binding protein [Streptomyces sp. CWNU-1]
MSSQQSPDSRGMTIDAPVAEASATGRTVYTESLRRAPESVRSARRLVSSALRAWGLERLEDTAWIVVTELMSNAVVHARLSTVRVTVTRRDQCVVRIAVVDRSRRVPQSQAADLDDESGRGLAIVAALCSGRWGAVPLRRGKCVWAEVELA